FSCSLLHFATAFFDILCSSDHRHLLSYPTRRSSDLFRRIPRPQRGIPVEMLTANLGQKALHDVQQMDDSFLQTVQLLLDIVKGRSEEHTSELQSRENLVCRLLLEKKKKQMITNIVAD